MSRKFTPEEKAAAKEALKDAEGEQAVLEKIAEMPDSDRAVAERIHAIVRKAAPDLSPRTWYGMPAYSNRDGKVVVFFRNASKFKERYAMLGFNDSAQLDDGSLWPIAYAVAKLTKADEAKIAKLVKQAVS
ncbi:MAG: iron chaperone [Gaiellaceae bacterium]